MKVVFACGHDNDISADSEPQCQCGNRRVVKVDAPRPTFRGVAKGPCAQYEELPGKPAGWK